jgi:L-amino acid N-acyltransferase YncA
MNIRPATIADWPAMWKIMRAVIADEDTYVFAASTPEADGRAYWLGDGIFSFVSEEDGIVSGMYRILANQRDLGDHVANASFMVNPEFHGRGIGRALGVSCLGEAAKLGFLAMQFNFVVSTNHAAVKLWESLGFSVVGTVPKAFRHKKLGLVDALVMHRRL